MINRSFKEFKSFHKKKINQVIYSSLNVKNENFLINLINNLIILYFMSKIKKTKK